MTDLEQHLVDLMTARAEQAPDDLGLLLRVQAASARRSRARRWGALGVAVATVAGVALGASVLTGGKPAADRFTDPTGFLVDSRQLLLSFPFTPTYPPTTKAPIYVHAEPGLGRATFTSALPVGGSVAVSVTVTPAVLVPLVPGSTTVQGAPAQITCRGQQMCTVTWRRVSGEYVSVSVDYVGVRPPKGLVRGEAVKVAQGLTDTPLTRRPQVVFGLLPAACRISSLDEQQTAVAPVGADLEHACELSANLSNQADAQALGLKPATVAGGRGLLAERQVGGGVQARRFWVAGVFQPDGRVLVVVVPHGGRWNRDELDRFVRAIIVPKKG